MFHPQHADWRSSGGSHASSGSGPWSGDHKLRPGTAITLASDTASLYRAKWEATKRFAALSPAPSPRSPTTPRMTYRSMASEMGETGDMTWREKLLSESMSSLRTDVHKQYHVGGSYATPAAGVRTQVGPISSTPWTVQTGKPPGGRGNSESYRYL